MHYELHKSPAAGPLTLWRLCAPMMRIPRRPAIARVSALREQGADSIQTGHRRRMSGSSLGQSLRKQLGPQAHAVLLCLVWLVAGCSSGPAFLPESEFTRLLVGGSPPLALTRGAKLDRAGLDRAVRLMQDRRLHPVYRGYLWHIAYGNLGSVSRDEARRLWFINHQEIAEATSRQASYSGSLTPDVQLWRSLQEVTGLRIAVDPDFDSLYDGSMGGTALEMPETPCGNLMDWCLVLCIPSPRCVVGFGSVFVTSGHEAWAERFPAAYERYQTAYKRRTGLGAGFED